MSYESESEALLYDILNDAFYKGFRDPSYCRKSTLELNITAACNQRCEYCYFTRRGNELYPPALRERGTIIRNIRSLFDYFLEESMRIREMDLFSGEIWGSGIGNDVLELILEYIGKGLGTTYILIPSNMTFILDDEKYAAVKEYIRKYRDAGCRLAFSVSVDGIYLEDEERPIADGLTGIRRGQEFYDELFRFCRQEHYAFHPMVAANGIEKWIRNFDWWQDMFRRYGMNPFEYGMYLEVRDDEWTLEKVEEYLKFVDHMVNHDLYELMHGDLSGFAKDVFSSGRTDRIRGYFPYIFTCIGNASDCSITTSLIVRCGDLAIGPCHRTCYDQFIYGKYRMEDGKITGIDANNVQLAQVILNQNCYSVMECCRCPVAYFCNRGCFGAQYEATGEILKPCESVCMLSKARMIYLRLKYQETGLFQAGYGLKNPSVSAFIDHILERTDMLKKGEPNLWKYWELVAQRIIRGN